MFLWIKTINLSFEIKIKTLKNEVKGFQYIHLDSKWHVILAILK